MESLSCGVRIRTLEADVKPRNVKIGLSNLGFERRPLRRAHCIPFEILDDVARAFSGITNVVVVTAIIGQGRGFGAGQGR